MGGYVKCSVCGSPAPEGKTLCWCCEHEKKLHKPEEDKCDDSCEIKPTQKEVSTK